MENNTPFLSLARRVCVLALYGFLAIVLAGPILTVVFTLLSFALVGFVLWLPCHALLHGRRDSVEKFKAFVRRGGAVLSGACAATVRACREVHATVRGTASFLGSVLLESLSGAVVAVLLVTACWPQQAVTPAAVSLAALFGAAAGVLVVLSRVRPAEPAEQSPEAAS